MITTILMKKNNVDVNLVRELSIFFYKGSDTNGRRFNVNEKTGLNYFGEYLERHEDRNVSIFDVLAAVCLNGLGFEFPEQQIYDGQYELFVERIEQRRKLGFDFELEILYTMFLLKMKREEDSKKVLKDLLSKMNLDNYFLVLCSLIRKKFLAIDEDCKDILIEKLKNNKISIDIEDLMETVQIKNDCYRFNSEHVELKYMFDTLGLTKSNFKGATDIFDSLKYLKKIGTRDIFYEKVKDILDVKEDEFYVLCLKIAADSYAEGSALVKTNGYLIDKLEQAVTINNNWYYKLPLTKLRVKGGTDNGQISLSKADFSDIKEEYFDSMVKAYSTIYSGITYDSIKEVCHKESFIAFMNSKKESLNYDCRNLILNVIKQDTDKNIIESYYNIIKDDSHIDSSEICLFCSKQLISNDYILDKVFDDEANVISIEYGSKEILKTCLNLELTDVLIEIVKKLNKNNVVLGICIEETLTSVFNYLEKKCFSDDLEDEFKKELLNILSDFKFMYFSKEYKKFLIKHIDNPFVLESLGIDREEQKNIAEYLLDSHSLSDEQIIKVKRIVLTEEDIFKENLEKEINNYIQSYNYSNGKIAASKHIINFIESLDNKEVIVAFLKEAIEQIGFSSKNDLEFMGIIRLIMATDLMNEDEIMDIIRDRLFVKVM